VEWSDEAIVLSARAFGDTGCILEALTCAHGRHLGLVHGGASRKMRGYLQMGNSIHVAWRARLNEHLGAFRVESSRSRAAAMLEQRDSLIGLGAFGAIASAVLPEREPHPGAFQAAEVLLDAMETQEFADWAPLYVRWELGLLDELGFGLDLSHCAATGNIDDLIYVSPRSGRAVSRQGGAEYADRLLKLPQFLLGAQNEVLGVEDIGAGLRLTEYFLLERVLQPHSKELPIARIRLHELTSRESH
jgi:DNA repair protein RecO (recombination protein O)